MRIPSRECKVATVPVGGEPVTRLPGAGAASAPTVYAYYFLDTSLA